MTRAGVTLASFIVLGAFVAVPTARGQEPPAPPPPPAAPRREAPKPVVPVKVQIVLSRYDGEKKIASLPFTLWVNANDLPTNLNMHTQVAVATNAQANAGNGSLAPPITSVNYKTIGTGISCEAATLDDGRIRLRVTVNDNSMLPDKGAGAMTTVAGFPSFQDFTSSNVLILKDGQTAQYAAATDAVSGQVTKIDVTVTVIK
jgi:hypothetical protein